MGISTRYVESDDVLVIVWDGAVSLGQWEEVARVQLSDESTWRQGRRRLIDLTTFVPSELNTTDVAHIVALTRARIRSVAGRRQAIVAPSAWDLAREFAHQSEQLGATTIVFDRIDPACAWLGIDPASVHPVLVELRAALRASTAPVVPDGDS